MKTLKIITLIMVVILSVATAIVVWLKYLKPSKAFLSIKSVPSATVSINDMVVGKTPLEINREAGEITLKLVPENPDSFLVSYETKVNLLAGFETIINWEMGVSEDASGGQVISYEKIGKNETQISLTSIPDYAEVAVDGNIRGYSPVLNHSSSPANHEITVSQKGYLDSVFTVEARRGYESIIMIKLIKNGEIIDIDSDETASPSAAPVSLSEKIYVQILDTPSGFLRVRAEGSTGSAEVARVKPGDKLLYISKDAKSEWYEVEYIEGKKGWIFSQFAKILD